MEPSKTLVAALTEPSPGTSPDGHFPLNREYEERLLRLCATQSLDWQSPGGHYGISVLVNNATHKQYLVMAPNAGLGAFTQGTPYTTATEPRFIGVELMARL
jgi:hypothetical protein